MEFLCRFIWLSIMGHLQPTNKLLTTSKPAKWMVVLLTWHLLQEVHALSESPGRCGSNEMVNGYGLIGHQYKSLTTDRFYKCYLACDKEDPCQSLTYCRQTQQCQLNNETKNSKPEDYKKIDGASYIEKALRSKAY